MDVPGIPIFIFSSLRRKAQIPQCPLYGGNVIPVDDPLAVVEDDHRYDLAMVAIAPFLERFPVLADVPAGIGDSFSGEITFHLGAVRSAAADVDGDGRMVGSAGEELGRRGAAKKRSRDEEEGYCHHQGTLPAWVGRGCAHVRAVLHGYVFLFPGSLTGFIHLNNGVHRREFICLSTH